jgi:catechol 2,3-dioxygenase
MTKPAPAQGISHLVLNVRDLDASHRFWTEVMGWECSGELHMPNAIGTPMRFYRGSAEHHHDLALCQIPDPESVPDAPAWNMRPTGRGVNHVAIKYDRDAWLQQIEHLQACGVKFAVRGNHGMTHSAYVLDPDGYALEILYDLPKDVWEDDVDAALNYFEPLPRRGSEALEDRTDYPRFPRPEPEPV